MSSCDHVTYKCVHGYEAPHAQCTHNTAPLEERDRRTVQVPCNRTNCPGE